MDLMWWYMYIAFIDMDIRWCFGMQLTIMRFVTAGLFTPNSNYWFLQFQHYSQRWWTDQTTLLTTSSPCATQPAQHQHAPSLIKSQFSWFCLLKYTKILKCILNNIKFFYFQFCRHIRNLLPVYIYRFTAFIDWWW